MKKDYLKGWPETVREAKKIQRKLKKKRNFENQLDEVKTVCGCDVEYSDGKIKAACAVYSYSLLDKLEVKTSEEEVDVLFPYVPGLFAFRELPFIFKAIEKLKTPVDLFILDGHGRMHPEGLGMAVHMGILIEKPTIGCAKSSLYGNEKDVANTKGAYSLITSVDEGVIGAKVRTKKNVKPIYISQGWGISLEKSIETTLNCCRGYRMPQVLRAAHKEAK